MFNAKKNGENIKPKNFQFKKNIQSKRYVHNEDVRRIKFAQFKEDSRPKKEVLNIDLVEIKKDRIVQYRLANTTLSIYSINAKVMLKDRKQAMPSVNTKSQNYSN